MSSNRVMIDATAGVIELEGEAEFVEAQLEKLLPLIATGGFRNSSEKEASDPPATATDPKLTAAKRGRRAASRPPKGHSCADRMMVLREDGFFKQQRTPAQIVEGLAVKGWTHTPNQASAAGGQMFNRGDIQRTKVGNGFAYFWDRG